MKSRLFWKTWLSLCLMLGLAYTLSVVVSAQLAARSDLNELRERPWRVIETLAMEAERIAESGGDLGDWAASAETNRLGDVFLLDAAGEEVNQRPLPALVRRALLRPFARATSAAAQPTRSAPPPGLARTVVLPDGSPPLTLMFLPRPERPAWGPPLPIVPVLILVGVIICGCGAWWLYHHTVSPIQALNAASARIADGDFSVRVAGNIGRRRDEVADLAKRFDDMTRKLGAASRARMSLFRDVSHELRSPLTRIRIAAELLTTSPAENRPALADRLDREIGEMDRLIDEILTLSLRLTTAPADVDDRLFRRAVKNLIDNAIHHTPSGSRITVALDRHGAGYRLRVRDTGPGVAADELESIFEPFARSVGNPHAGPGSGIGLAIVAGVIAAHGGTVAARNCRPRGFEVSIDVPEWQPT